MTEEDLSLLEHAVRAHGREIIAASARLTQASDVAFLLVPTDEGFELRDAIDLRLVETLPCARLTAQLPEHGVQDEGALERWRTWLIEQGVLAPQALLACPTVAESMDRLEAEFERLVDRAKEVLAQREGDDARTMIESLVAMVKAQHALLERQKALATETVELAKKITESAVEVMAQLGMPDELHERYEQAGLVRKACGEEE